MSDSTASVASDLMRTLGGGVRDSATGAIVVDLSAIADNWRALQNRVAPSKCAAVVKADAYGLGADRAIPALSAAGCDTFFVATLEEAFEATALTSDAAIYMLDGLMPGMTKEVAASGIHPVLSSLPEIEDWAAAGASRSRPLPCALHIDTGLNRLGLSATEIDVLASATGLLEHLDIKLVMSHLACADEPAHTKNAQQRKTFKELHPRLPKAALSLAASDGLMLGPDFHFDLVRPGYALYGGQALPGRITPVKPVVEVYARVLQVRDVAPGETVGYSATYEAQRPSRIAVIASGYADGSPRHLTATRSQRTGQVAFGGHLAPMVGRVSMDLVTVDVTAITGPPVQRGDWAELIGPNISLEDVGEASGTIGYEILTRLSPRFERLYVNRGRRLPASAVMDT